MGRRSCCGYRSWGLPDWYVINGDHHTRAGEEGIVHCRGNGALRDDAGWDGGFFFLPYLDTDEGNEEDAGEEETDDNSRTAPGVLGAAPLEREEEAYCAAEEDDGTYGIEALYLFA